MEPMQQERHEIADLAQRTGGILGDDRGRSRDTRGLDIAALVAILFVIWGPLAAGALS